MEYIIGALIGSVITSFAIILVVFIENRSDKND